MKDGYRTVYIQCAHCRKPLGKMHIKTADYPTIWPNSSLCARCRRVEDYYNMQAEESAIQAETEE